MVDPTTRATAEACMAACTDRHGGECTAIRQLCGLPRNSATGTYAGSEAFTSCMGRELVANPGATAADSARAAAQVCSRDNY